MHGLIFAELQKYAETKHGKGTWQALLKKAGLETKIYLAIQEYPDAEVVALVVAASSMTGLPVAEVLEDFGEFIVPDLVKMWAGLLSFEKPMDQDADSVPRWRKATRQPRYSRVAVFGPA